MGVFKWLRRERVTVTSRRNISAETPGAAAAPDENGNPESVANIGTIRTEEYKRDLAEFQARRSGGKKDLETTPLKKKCGRHSLPVSCTECTGGHDNTFNYEKKSASKYKKKSHKRAKSANTDEQYEALPNIQFLFQNQVFMPGNMFAHATYTAEPEKGRRTTRHRKNKTTNEDVEYLTQKRIDFNEDVDEQPISPPLFYKNNSLPYDSRAFLEDAEEVDGHQAVGSAKGSSQSSSSSSKDDEDKLIEVMSELKKFDHWADEQLGVRSPNSTKSEDNKSETSVYGLPVVTVSELDMTIDKDAPWTRGSWGAVPVQLKKLPAVTMDDVKMRGNTEINILRKCRHPNIILLMGLYPDIHNNVNIVCEQCVDSLYGILHLQGRILSVQTAVQYACDVANALVFLRMRGYVHSELTSRCIMVTARDAAKLADLATSVRVEGRRRGRREVEMYSARPEYVNIGDTNDSMALDCEPLLSANPSEVYLSTNAAVKDYETYRHSEMYRWHAPELFTPDACGQVHVCSKSDVYSLFLVLWESCNASVPWKSLTYDKLKELYTLWKTGIRLPSDGTYPGSLLDLMQGGLQLDRDKRLDLTTAAALLRTTKQKLDELEYIVIPAILSKKRSDFSSVAWETNSPTDSECLSPITNIQHKAVVHESRDSSESEKECSKSDASPLYETIRKERRTTMFFVPDETDDKNPISNYEHLNENGYSSVCSTPVSKIRARIKDIGTPGLHRSDSTEYCSILSPDNRNFAFNDDSNREQSATEKATAKLSRSFTPKSYKPLHIKVPDYNLDDLKSLPKEGDGKRRSSYNFDIANYSLPTTPIARSNKLRKNAWLSGDLSVSERSGSKKRSTDESLRVEDNKKAQSAPETPVISTASSTEKGSSVVQNNSDNSKQYQLEERSPESVDTARDSFTGLKRTDPPQDFLSPDIDFRERTHSWSFKSSIDRSPTKSKVEDDAFAGVNVRPLVAIHERWIYEANKKTGRSMSLPEDNRSVTSAVKPASHCVDTLQQSLPSLGTKRPHQKYYSRHNSCDPPFRHVARRASIHDIEYTNISYERPLTPIPQGNQSEQFCLARDAIARSVNFTPPHADKYDTRTWKRDRADKSITMIPEEQIKPAHSEQAADSQSIEQFIKEIIRKEFQHLMHEVSENRPPNPHTDEILNKGVANIIDALNANKDDSKNSTINSFSRIKINGNNKPLVHITFARTGENSLQVLDNCVNVTICDNNPADNGKEKVNVSMDEATLTADDFHAHSLKRCQAFNALQEARSTEDLYIDDDLSTMQDNFGGKVKLIPLHGSLHEILCEREDDCCLIKVKQENGCDTIYFRCDNSDTESRDAIDGCSSKNTMPKDTVVYKRSISLIEERYQRVFPKEANKRVPAPVLTRKKVDNFPPLKTRPKSEVFVRRISKESRVLSNSSPSLIMKDDKLDRDDVEVNIESVMSYQDSSSDECLKCQAESDDFELLEKEIEEDVANKSLKCLGSKCLDKISEENLSTINEESSEREFSSDTEGKCCYNSA